MGESLSKEERAEKVRKSTDEFVKKIDKDPDPVRIDPTIQKFCSVRSLDNLRQHYENRKLELGDCPQDWMKSLVEKLGALTNVPEAMGLVALAIAIIIDIESATPAEQSTKDALRCVFAEEKASEVWDQIDECIKRCMMNINNRAELQSDIKRIEYQLSAALTKLKNSMVRDREMTPRALKTWVNGAAFHIQMMIHLVKTGELQTCDPVKRLLDTYQSDLDILFTEHKALTRRHCHVKSHPIPMTGIRYKCFLTEERKEYGISDFPTVDEYFEAYYNHKFSSQKDEIQEHFTEVKENLPMLISQSGYFIVD